MSVAVKRLSDEEGYERIKDWPIAQSSDKACLNRENDESERCNRPKGHVGLHAHYIGTYGRQDRSRVQSYWVRS